MEDYENKNDRENTDSANNAPETGVPGQAPQGGQGGVPQNPYEQPQNGGWQNPYEPPQNGTPQNPYGQPQNGGPQNPYGQQPQNGAPQDPYGQPQNSGWQNPYGQQPQNGAPQNPYGQQPQNGGWQNPYGNQNPYNNQNPYGGQNPYGQQPVTPKVKNSFATASLVCGILGILPLCCMMFPLAIIMGVGAIAFAIISKKGRPFTGPAIAGIVLGVITILLGIGEFLYILFVYQLMQDPQYSDMFNQLYEQMEQMRQAQ